MKTLVIHPEDPTTDFLKGVYEGLEDITVIHGLTANKSIRKLIKSHDRVIALGHGTPNGLLGVGMFYGTNYALDHGHTKLLREGKDNIYIWCNADQFVQRYGLPSPLYTGMFISEVGEALMMGHEYTSPQEVSESNAVYASIINEELKKNTPDQTQQSVLNFMMKKSDIFKNDVMCYNWERLYST